MSTEEAANSVQRRRPAIGLIATNANIGDIARIVVHANERGYESLVAYDDEVEFSQIQFVRALGGHLVHPEDVTDSWNELRQRIEREAERLNFPGVLFQHSHDRLELNGRELPVDSPSTAPIVLSTEPVEDDDFPATETVVAIPAYNEAGSIGDVVREANQFVDEVLVIDDGSADATVKVALEAGATVVEHVENRGYGAALRTAFKEANRRNASQLVILDADGQHDPNDIPKLLETQRDSEAEIVVGSRFVEGASCNAPLYRLFGLWTINLLTNLSLGVVRSESWVTDTQSGFRVYGERAIASLAADGTIGESMSASTDILYHAHRHAYCIEETGITVNYDVENPSSQNPFLHGLTLVTNILNTVERERPLLAFGIPGVILVLLGIVFTFFATTGVGTSGMPPLGFTIASIIFTMIGIFSCFTALILHSITGLIKRERYAEPDTA